MLNLNPLKRAKNHPKKLQYRPKTLVIKVKTPFFGHFFVNNFFRMRFFSAFSTDSKSASNSTFLYTYFIFEEKLVWIILALFTNSVGMAAKNEKLCKKYFLELKFATSNGLGEPSC